MWTPTRELYTNITLSVNCLQICCCSDLWWPIYVYVAENQLVAESGTKVIIEIETPTKAIQCSYETKSAKQCNHKRFNGKNNTNISNKTKKILSKAGSVNTNIN